MLLNDNRYCEEHVIASHMVDGMHRITPTYLFYLMQDAAVNNLDTIGCGWDFLHQFKMFWALSKMDVQILRCPKRKEKIRLITWGKKHNYLIQPRDYLIETMEGEPMVRATSNWVLLDFNGKPHTVDIIEAQLRNNHIHHAIEKPATRLRQAVTTNHPHFKPVVYSNIDMNMHVNNASYVTWVMDNFSNDFHNSHELISLSINFLQQTHKDDFYAIAQKEEPHNEFQCSIYIQQDNIEVCRVRTLWV